MKKQILIVAASLALLSGCDGRENGTGAFGSASAVAETSAKVAAVPVPAMPPLRGADEGMEQAAAAPDLVTGEKVYKGTCSICHKSGLKGARAWVSKMIGNLVSPRAMKFSMIVP